MSNRHQCGWVVRHAVFVRNGRPLVSFWHGPESWGQHFGPLVDDKSSTLSIEVAVFCTRQDARDAVNATNLEGCTVVPLDVALDELTPKAVAS